jgi:hypothetical protein
MNVAVDHECLCSFMEDRLEASLKQWSGSTVFSIEPYAVADIKPMDRFAKVCLSAFQLQMVVVPHQGIGVELYSESFGQAAQ